MTEHNCKVYWNCKHPENYKHSFYEFFGCLKFEGACNSLEDIEFKETTIEEYGVGLTLKDEI